MSKWSARELQTLAAPATLDTAPKGMLIWEVVMPKLVGFGARSKPFGGATSTLTRAGVSTLEVRSNDQA